MLTAYRSIPGPSRPLLWVGDDPPDRAKWLPEGVRAALAAPASQHTWQEFQDLARPEPDADLFLVFGKNTVIGPPGWSRLREILSAPGPRCCWIVLPSHDAETLGRAIELLSDNALEISTFSGADGERRTVVAAGRTALAKPDLAARLLARARNELVVLRAQYEREREQFQRRLDTVQGALERLRSRYDLLTDQHARLIASKRWKYATWVAELVRHPGRLAARLLRSSYRRAFPSRLSRAMSTAVARALEAPLSRALGARAGGALVSNATLSAPRIELGRLLASRRAAAAGGPLPGGAFLVWAGDDGTPEVQSLTPNDWAFHLDQARRGVLAISVGPEFEWSGWRGGLAGVGQSEADALMKLMHSCRQRRFPVVLHLPPPPERAGYSSTILPLVDALAGRPQELPEGPGAPLSLRRIALDHDRCDPATLLRAFGQAPRRR